MLSVIIPTYNESGNIVPLLKEVSRLGDEVVVVDDSSPDNTGLLARKFGRNVRTIIRPGKMGLNSAILQGVHAARNNEIIVMDADFSHPPSLIPEIRHALEDHDIVIARRSRVVGWGLTRHIVSKVAGLLAQLVFFRWRVSEPMSGFFGVKKAIVEKYQRWISPRGYKILFTILRHYTHDHGYDKICSVDYVFIDRKVGKSKLSMKVIIDYFKSVFRSKTFEHQE